MWDNLCDQSSIMKILCSLEKLLLPCMTTLLMQVDAGILSVPVPRPPYKYGSQEVDYYAPPKYAFKYGVSDPSTGDHKTQTEIRDGGVVKGQYSLVEPDGSVRTVNYVADPVNGFNAFVSHSGPNIHSEPGEHLAPKEVTSSAVKTPVDQVGPVYVKPLLPTTIKTAIVAPSIVQFPKPVVKYTNALGYPKEATPFYADYDSIYEYQQPYDHDIYGDSHSRY